MTGFTYQICVLTLLIAQSEERRKHWHQSWAPTLTSPGASTRLFLFSNRKVTNEIVWGYESSLSEGEPVSKTFLFPSLVTLSELELPTSVIISVFIYWLEKKMHYRHRQVTNVCSASCQLGRPLGWTYPPALLLQWLVLKSLQFWVV